MVWSLKPLQRKKTKNLSLKRISSFSSFCGRTCPILAEAGGTQSQLKLARVETKNATDLGCFVLPRAQIQVQIFQTYLLKETIAQYDCASLALSLPMPWGRMKHRTWPYRLRYSLLPYYWADFLPVKCLKEQKNYQMFFSSWLWRNKVYVFLSFKIFSCTF